MESPSNTDNVGNNAGNTSIGDRIRGMIAFLAIGDALGVPHEFKYQHQKYTGKLEHTPYLWNRFQGKKNLVVGQYSDDTELTITLARNIIKNSGRYVRELLILDYLEWDNSGTPMRGKNTRALFDNIKTIKGYEARYKKIHSDINNSSQSNGCLMRCSPLAVLKDFNPVVEDCKITNPHPVCIDACQVHIFCIKCCLGIRNSDNTSITSVNNKAKILNGAAMIAKTQEVKEVITSVLDSDKSRNLSVNKGWVLHGLYAGLAGFYLFDNPRDAMDWIIGDHPGSDTDTNACIYGSLAGAYYGFGFLMRDLVIKSNWNTVISADPDLGDIKRPNKYQLKDFDDICTYLTAIYKHNNT